MTIVRRAGGRGLMACALRAADASDLLEAIAPDAARFPPCVEAVPSGRVHRVQAVSDSTSRPPPLVAGNRATRPVVAFAKFSAARSPRAGATVRHIVPWWRSDFVTMERAAAGRTITAYDRNRGVLATGALAARKVAGATAGPG